MAMPPTPINALNVVFRAASWVATAKNVVSFRCCRACGVARFLAYALVTHSYPAILPMPYSPAYTLAAHVAAQVCAAGAAGGRIRMARRRPGSGVRAPGLCAGKVAAAAVVGRRAGQPRRHGLQHP